MTAITTAVNTQGHFLFTCSDTCCKLYRLAITLSVTDGRTDRRTDHANSRSYCQTAFMACHRLSSLSFTWTAHGDFSGQGCKASICPSVCWVEWSRTWVDIE